MNPWIAGIWQDLAYGEWREDYYDIIHIPYTVLTNTHTGERFLYYGPIPIHTKHHAECLSRRINAYISKNPHYAPKMEYWHPTYPVYGSPAYEENQPLAIAEEIREDMEGWSDRY